MVDLVQFSDPQAARVEVQVVDRRGGRGEARVDTVFRQLVHLYRQLVV